MTGTRLGKAELWAGKAEKGSWCTALAQKEGFKTGRGLANVTPTPPKTNCRGWQVDVFVTRRCSENEEVKN